jgi:HAD superfamily hydrolase (TIGR01549 family)
MIDPKNIRAVLFDFGGTLGYDEPAYAEGFAKMISAAGYPVDLALYSEASETVKETQPERPRDLEPWLEWREGYTAELLRRFGVPDGKVPEMMMRVKTRFRYYSRAACYTETKFVLRTLRRLGYVVGVISNIAPPLPLVLEELNIDRYLHFAIASDTFGVAKPDPSIFHEGVRLAGFPAEQCMYVGDDPGADVVGSSGIGMQPCFINRHGHNLDRNDTLVVTNLVEILDWLGVDCWSDEDQHDFVPSR